MGMRKLKFIRISNLLGVLLMFPGIYFYINLPVPSPYSYIIPISVFLLGFVIVQNSAFALDSVKEEVYSKILPNDQIPIFFQIIYALSALFVFPLTMFLFFSPIIFFIIGIIENGDLQETLEITWFLYEWQTEDFWTGLPIDQPSPPTMLMYLGVPSSFGIVWELFCILNNYKGLIGTIDSKVKNPNPRRIEVQ